MTIPYLALGLYLVAGIFYILPSGLPQPADFLLMLAMVFAIIVWRKIPRVTDLYIVLGMFIMWVVFVNVVYFVLYSSTEFLFRSMYYIFNISVFAFVIIASYRNWEKMRTIIRWACVVALFAQLAHLLLVGATTTSGVRSVGTFNNPNQLGYWALLAMAILAVAKDRDPLSMVDLAALAAGAYALLLSLSKAATVSGAILIIMIFVFCHNRNARAALAAMLGVGIVAVALGFSDQITNWDSANALSNRFDSKGTDDDIMTRGYRVIVENPKYWLFGAGEGEYPRRFAEGILRLEIHSTIGSLFFSYGLIGLGLFGVVLWIVFRNAPIASLAYFGPIMMYGVTHNGVRSSELWIFLALVYAQRRTKSQFCKESTHVSRSSGSNPERQRQATSPACRMRSRQEAYNLSLSGSM